MRTRISQLQNQLVGAMLVLITATAGAALPGNYQGRLWETSLYHGFGVGFEEEYCFSRLDILVNGDLTWAASGVDEVCWGRSTTNTSPPRDYDNFDGTSFQSTDDFSSQSTRSLVSAGGNLHELFGESVIGGIGQGEERLGTVLSEPTGDDLLIVGGRESVSSGSEFEASHFVDLLVKATPAVRDARVAADLEGKWRTATTENGLSLSDVNTETGTATIHSFELQAGGVCVFTVSDVFQDLEFDTSFDTFFANEFDADGGVNLGNRGVEAGIADATGSGCTYGIDGNGYLAMSFTVTDSGGPAGVTFQFVVSDDNNYLVLAPDPDGVDEESRTLLVGYREPSTAMMPPAIDGTFMIYLVLTEYEATGTAHSGGETGDQEHDGLGRGKIVFDSATAGTIPQGQAGDWFSCNIDLALHDVAYSVAGEPLAGTVSFSSQSLSENLPLTGCDYSVNADGGLLLNLTLTEQGEPPEETLLAGYINHSGELLSLVDLGTEPDPYLPADPEDFGNLVYILGMRYTGDPDADTDGDGFVNAAEFKMPLPPPGAWGDMDGDGNSDILWRNQSTGQVNYWQMDGDDINQTANVDVVSDIDWKIGGKGDYNGDGRMDMLWRHNNSGEMVFWQMIGSTIVSRVKLPTVGDLNWKIVGSGDYDGDNMSDLLWHHAITGSVYLWKMSGGVVTSSSSVTTVTDTDWQVVGNGDFNGDGMDDVLWRNISSGQVNCWQMNGDQIMDIKYVDTVRPNLNWTIVGDEDYNSDGIDDVMWYRTTDGKVFYWQMLDGTVAFRKGVTFVNDLNWQIVDGGAYGGNSASDILWYYGPTGQVNRWQMNAEEITAISNIAIVGNLDWKIVPRLENSTSSAGFGAIRYQITFDAMWTAADFPTNFPANAHFSNIVGTAHNEQVVFWEVNGQPATVGIESMAETGSTSAFSTEISAAQDSGNSFGVSEGSGIGSGDGETDLEFDVSANYPFITFVSMVAPSPDWFVGIGGFSLLDNEGKWKIHEEIPLKVYDAGTDLGLRPTSANQDNSADNLPITLLSSDRADTDFEDGVHFQSSIEIGIFTIDMVQP